MNDMKCPFCNETELEKGIELQSGGFILGCPKCKKFARDVFWQELIRTRKALEIAVDALKELKETVSNTEQELYMTIQAENALEQITELEQKG